jgi:hypothetical protein
MNLFENWSEAKTALLEGLPSSKRKVVEVCLENQKQHLLETAGDGVQSAGAISTFQKIVIPMIRRIIPGTIATEIVGTQPMTGPTGLVYSLRYVYAQALATGAAATDIAKGDEIFGNNGKTKRFYTGGVDGSDVATGKPGDTLTMESTGGRNITLEVLKQTVTANTRTLGAKWSTESMQDLSSQHGLDIESELTSAMSAQIVSEIDNEIITDLLELAGTSETFDMNGTFTGVPHFVGDRFAVLGVLINKVANVIARKIRQGSANFIVVSPLVASVLQSATKSVFAPAVAGSFEGPNGTKLIGTLNGSIKVYTYLYHDQGTEPILIGFKGSDQTAAGYFYCPYVPLTASGIVTDPVTFNHHLRLQTRYGKATFTNSSTSLGNSADFYGKINVANIVFA